VSHPISIELAGYDKTPAIGLPDRFAGGVIWRFGADRLAVGELGIESGGGRGLRPQGFRGRIWPIAQRNSGTEEDTGNEEITDAPRHDFDVHPRPHWWNICTVCA
jgi:hypothetical protein